MKFLVLCCIIVSFGIPPSVVCPMAELLVSLFSFTFGYILHRLKFLTWDPISKQSFRGQSVFKGGTMRNSFVLYIADSPVQIDGCMDCPFFGYLFLFAKLYLPFSLYLFIVGKCCLEMEVNCLL